MRKRLAASDVEAAEGGEELQELLEASARPSEEFFDAVEAPEPGFDAPERDKGEERRGPVVRRVFGQLAGAARSLGREARKGPRAIVAEFLESAEVRETVGFLARTTSQLRSDASDARADIFDKARAATADAVMAKFDGWLTRQRRFNVEDPAMPPWAARALPPLFDLLGGELRRVVESLVEEELRLRARRASAVERRGASPSGGCKVGVLAAFRNRLLYALQPYDRTPWERSRTLDYWVVKVLCACPYFGVNTVAFFLILVCIDRGDTFQLVEFLLSFKQNMFWFTGLWALVVSATTMHWCAAVALPGDPAACGRDSAKDLSLTLPFGVKVTGGAGKGRDVGQLQTAPISVVFHSFRLNFRRATISRNGLEA